MSYQETSGICPSEYKELVYKGYTSDYCYMVVTGKENDETKKTWSEADVHCMMHGGDLASIHGEDEMLAIADAIGGVSDVWIGLQKSSNHANLRVFRSIIFFFIMSRLLLFTID